MKMDSKKKRRMIAWLMVCSLAAGVCSGFSNPEAKAQSKRRFTLQMAKASAVVNSAEIEKLESQLATKEVSLKQAIKSIQLKKTNMATFRWSPLLSFKFPTKPDLAEAYEFQYKPLSIQSEIDTIRHKLTDQVLAEYESVSSLYVDIVIYEESIAFNEERIAVLEDTINKNQGRLLLGEANQSDIDAMQKSLLALQQKTAADKRRLESAKTKLSKAVGFDISTGYTFENPLVEADIDRSRLTGLIQYTLDRDQAYYEVSEEATMARISLQTNYNLMNGQYSGAYMSIISPYVNQVLNGGKVSSKAFKKDYDIFLQKIDESWQGKKKILFIKIPKVWFKGEIDGIRYVEDEPYALYEAALEYQDARLEQETVRADLEQQVKDAFDNYISVRNSYQSYVAQVETAEKELQAMYALNKLGELTYEEYGASREEYEELQNELFETLALYSQTLYSLDRLTCGGVTALLEGTGVDLSVAEGGESYVEEEYLDGAYYTIRPIIQEEEFQLSVSIPDDFEVEITDFELWCDDQQVGERTSIDSCIRHLMLAVEQVSEVKLRFYNEDRFIDDCVIDPEQYSGPLEIVAGYSETEEAADLEIGTYVVKQNEVTGMITITLKPNASEGIRSYLIRTGDGKYLYTEEAIPVDTPFTYLPVLLESLSEVEIVFFDGDGNQLETGRFDTSGRKLLRNV